MQLSNTKRTSGLLWRDYTAIALGCFLFSSGVLVLWADLASTFQLESFGSVVAGLAFAALPTGVVLVVLGSLSRPKGGWVSAIIGVLLAPVVSSVVGYNMAASIGWQLQCRAGDAFTCNAAGDLLAFGIGVQQDGAKAWELYARACAEGRKDSCPFELCKRLRRSVNKPPGQLGLKSIDDNLKHSCSEVTACRDQRILLEQWRTLLHQDQNWDSLAYKALTAPQCFGAYGVAKTIPAEGLDSLDVVFKRKGNTWELVTYGTSFVDRDDLGEAKDLLEINQ